MSPTPRPLTEPEELLARSVLSHVLFDYYRRKPTSTSSALGRLLRLYAATPTRLGNKGYPPLMEERPKFPVRAETTVHNANGSTPDGIRADWEELKIAEGDGVAFQADLLHEFIPRETWPVVAAMAADGPAVFGRRVHALLLTERDRKVKANKRRPTGGYVSQAHINSAQVQAKHVATALAQIAVLPDHPSAELLGQWRVDKPGFPHVKSRAGESGTLYTTGTPPRHQVRTWFQDLNAVIRKRLKVDSNDPAEELAAVQALSLRALRQAALYRLVRARAILVLLAVTGSRIEAVVDLNQADVVERHRHPDGVAPAVRLLPGKTAAGQHRRWKPIPYEAWLCLEAYRLLVEKLQKCELAPEEPLLFGAYPKRWTSGLIRDLIGGSPSRGIKAALPLDPAEPFVGYIPQSLRRWAKSACSSSEAKVWCEEHGIDPDRRELIGEVLLSHELSDMPALYRGDASPEGMERLAWQGTNITWELLATERGGRRVLDADSYRSALRRSVTLEEKVRAEEQGFGVLCSEAERNGRELSVANVMGRHQNVLQLQKELTEAQRTITAIESRRPETMVAVSDQLSDDEAAHVDLQAIRNEVLNGVPDHKLRGLPRVRNWFAPEEYAGVVGIGGSTMRSYITKGLPAGKNLWDHKNPPVIEFNSRRRALHVDGLALDLHTPEQRVAIEELLAQDPPEGWTNYPRMMPAPFQGSNGSK